VNWVSLAFEVVPGQGQVRPHSEECGHIGVAGLSVTMPQGRSGSMVDTCTEVAARLGSVNCIINEGGQLRGAIRR